MAAGAPEGYPSVSPYLLVEDAESVIAFLERVFGGKLVTKMQSPSGGVRHAEVRIADSIVMIGERPPGSVTSHGSVHVYVDDVDATYQRALDAGAAPVSPPRDHDYGDRGGGVRDVDGNFWWIGKHGGAKKAH